MFSENERSLKNVNRKLPYFCWRISTKWFSRRANSWKIDSKCSYDRKYHLLLMQLRCLLIGVHKKLSETPIRRILGKDLKNILKLLNMLIRKLLCLDERKSMNEYFFENPADEYLL